VLDADPLNGSLFLFVDHRKIMRWGYDGLVLFYKNLETENAHVFLFAEVGRLVHNRRIGSAESGRTV
jgi:hypothetical protein